MADKQLYEVLDRPVHSAETVYEPGEQIELPPDAACAFEDNLTLVEKAAQAQSEQSSSDDKSEEEENTSDESDTSDEDSSEDEAPDPDEVVPDEYEEWNMGEFKSWVQDTDLSDEEFEAVITYEEDHKDRSTILEDFSEMRDDAEN